MIKGALTGFDEATPDDFVAADLSPAQPPTALAPPELPLHQAIYTARPEVAAIVHSHAPAGLVFGALDTELVPLSHEARCWPAVCTVSPIPATPCSPSTSVRRSRIASATVSRSFWSITAA